MTFHSINDDNDDPFEVDEDNNDDEGWISYEEAIKNISSNNNLNNNNRYSLLELQMRPYLRGIINFKINKFNSYRFIKLNIIFT